MDKDLIKQCRFFLKDTIRKMIDFSRTDQYLGVPPPPIQKPFSQDAKRIVLPGMKAWQDIGKADFKAIILNRESHRSYLEEALTLGELAFLLWASQGIKERLDEGHALRTVPSAGCRHSLETYLCVLNIDGLERGIYRYLPLEHQLLLLYTDQDLDEKIFEATFNQSYPAVAAVTLIWTTIPYRMEWRYGPASAKVIAIEAGHACQNLYLACEAIGAGACAMAAYDQQAMDHLLHIDGEDEFTLYLASVGRKL
ncbi:MAG: SagB/ThcOx family dehydrogenase [Syntrophales bacterium]|jgi:SagB-type dehydrogenase family enzyme|nr:SagB/ThcOx family dehydrogenase [Syntrophales bacterium]